jgi:hypothetical protein
MFSMTAVTPTVASWASLIALAMPAMLSSRLHSPHVEPEAVKHEQQQCQRFQSRKSSDAALTGMEVVK